jgi:prepilin peptidase CpaA
MLPHVLPLVLSMLLVLAAAWYDASYRRIPNWLTLPSILVGWVLALLLGGPVALKWSAVGFGFGLGVFLLPWLFGGMGGGDVKLMAGLGAILGWPMVLWVALLSCVVALLLCAVRSLIDRKLLAVAVSTWRVVVYGFRGLIWGQSLEEIGEGTKEIAIGYVPFGLSIAIGTGLAVVFRVIAPERLMLP